MYKYWYFYIIFIIFVFFNIKNYLLELKKINLKLNERKKILKERLRNVFKNRKLKRCNDTKECNKNEICIKIFDLNKKQYGICNNSPYKKEKFSKFFFKNREHIINTNNNINLIHVKRINKVNTNIPNELIKKLRRYPEIIEKRNHKNECGFKNILKRNKKLK
jgi:hypothetical protein